MFSRVRACVCVVLAFLLSLLFVFRPAPVSFGPMTLEEYFASLVPGLSDITIAWEKLEAAYAPSVLTVRYPDRHDPYGPILVYITHPSDLPYDELPIDEHKIDEYHIGERPIDTTPVLDTSIPSAITPIDALLVAAPIHIASVVLDTTIPNIIPAIDASLDAPRPGALPRPSHGPSSTVLLIAFIVLTFNMVLAGTLFVRRAIVSRTRRPSACTQSELGQSPSQLEPHTAEEYVHDSTIPTCKLPLPVAELAQSPRRATPLESPTADAPAHESTTPTTPARGLPLPAPERTLVQSSPRVTQDEAPAADEPAYEATTPTPGGGTPTRSRGADHYCVPDRPTRSVTTSDGALSPRPLVMHPRPAVFEPGFQFYATPLPTSRTAAAPPAVYSPPLAVVRSYNEIYSTPRPAPGSSTSPSLVHQPLTSATWTTSMPNSMPGAANGGFYGYASTPYQHQHHFYAGPQPFLHPQLQVPLVLDILPDLLAQPTYHLSPRFRASFPVHPGALPTQTPEQTLSPHPTSDPILEHAAKPQVPKSPTTSAAGHAMVATAAA
ncbi:hypothetical protein C8R44DRAFT_896364 [Mycena epipterygia]|nr:hypothetical protein C8R44DRAFT_896364 [Mycena epipterygia]